MNELKRCFRRLYRAPLFSAIAVITLALGIGANTVVLSWVETVLWNAVPGAENPKAMVALVHKFEDSENGSFSYKSIRDLTERTEDIFSAVTATDYAAVNVSVEDSFEWAWAEMVLTSFFDVIDVKPALGTLDFPGEDQASGSSPYVVISHRYWQRRFQGNPNIVGQSIEVNGYPMTVRGVTGEEFRGSTGGLNFDVWLPMGMFEQLGISTPLEEQSRGRVSYSCLASLKPGASTAQIETVLARVSAEFRQEFGDYMPKDFTLEAVPMWKAPNGGQEVLLPLLRVLIVVAVVVLLIVIANIAGLVLARSYSRQKEMSIRLAIGAGRTHVMKQVLSECLVLSLIGASGALLLAYLGVGQFSHFLPKSTLPTGYDFGLSWNILGITAIIAIAAGLFFGLLPAWQASRAPLQQVMSDAARGSEGRSRKLWVRRGLVSSQVAFAFVLVVCSVLCLQSVMRSNKLDLGFDPEQTWVASFRLEGLNLTEPEIASYYQRLEEKLGALPGVENVGFASDLPLGFDGFNGSSFSIPGIDDSDENRRRRFTRLTPISDDYLQTMKVSLLAGRGFDSRDTAEAPSVAIINETLAQRHFGDQDPLGKTISIWNRECTIVGITAAGKYGELNERPGNFVYFPSRQDSRENRSAVIRTQGAPEAIATAVERAAFDINPEVNVLHAMTMKDQIQPAFMLQNIASSFLTALAIIALLLAALGIYGVTAFNVNRRIREIGIRLALGALPSQVRKQVLSQGLRLTSIGLVVGIILSLIVAGLLSSFLIGVDAQDPITFTFVAGILIVVALLACYLPARKASRVDPMEALRCE